MTKIDKATTLENALKMMSHFKQDQDDLLRVEIDDITEAVLDKLLLRFEKGKRTYKKPMTRKDVSTAKWLEHFQEELLDATIYVERIIQDLRKK